MVDIIYEKFIRLSGKRTSTQRTLFLDMINNPDNYKGYVVYLTEIDSDEKYDPFEEPKKFYFNVFDLTIH